MLVSDRIVIHGELVASVVHTTGRGPTNGGRRKTVDKEPSYSDAAVVQTRGADWLRAGMDVVL